MLRRHSYAVLGLGLCLTTAHAHGQEKSGWLAAMESLETRGVRTLLPTHQLLLGELESESRKAEAAGDAKAAAEINAAAAKARRDHEALKKGRVPQSGGPDSLNIAFAQTANGLQWALTGTRNLKRIGMVDGRLHQFSEQGLDGGHLCRDQVIPNVFYGRRIDGDWGCYVISHDLEQVLTLITPQIRHAFWISGKKPSPVSAAPPPVKASEAEPLPETKGKVALRVLLERKYHQQRLEHEDKVIRLLESYLSEATGAEKPPIERRLVLAKTTRDALTQPPTPMVERVIETKEAFMTRLEGSIWISPGVLKSGSRLLFTADSVQSVGITGKVLQSAPMEVLWPGALRFKMEDGSQVLAAFSPDLDKLIFLPLKGQFPGKRVK